MKKPLSIIFLKYLHTAKILPYDFDEGQNYKNFFILTNLSWKRRKYVVQLLPFFILLVSAIWKSRHRHLSISIGIDVGIGIGIANFILLIEALSFAFRSFLLSKTSMVKSFSNTLESFHESVCCCLEQLFCRGVVSACFWRNELRHGRYLRSFKNTQGWKLQLECLCISDKEPY